MLSLMRMGFRGIKNKAFQNKAPETQYEPKFFSQN